jgi:hypothetical protein
MIPWWAIILNVSWSGLLYSAREDEGAPKQKRRHVALGFLSVLLIIQGCPWSTVHIVVRHCQAGYLP